MKFSLKVYGKLIDLVKANPCIYNTSMPQYRDAQEQQSIWRRITEEMDDPSMTWEDWRKAWRQKRDSFTRKRRELESLPPGSAAAQEIRKHPLYDQMFFLMGASPFASSDVHADDYEVTMNSDWHEEQMSSHGALDFSDRVAGKSRSGESDDSVQDLSTYDVATRIQKSHCHERPDKPRGQKRQRSDETSFTQASSTTTTSRVDRVLDEVNERSKESLELVKSISVKNSFARPQFQEAEDEDVDVFVFVSKRAKRLGQSTQTWLEDEVLKLYMEAKKRDGQQGGGGRVAKVEVGDSSEEV